MVTTLSKLQEELAAYKKPSSALPNNGKNGSSSPNAWQQLVAEKLVDWGKNPQQFEEDGLVAPTPTVLTDASTFAMSCANDGVQPPLRVVPDGSGGLAFEWRHGEILESVEFRADGKAELLIFENGKVVAHRSIG